MTIKHTLGSLLFISLIGCSASGPDLRYDATTLKEREIMTSGRLRSLYPDLVQDIADENLRGADAERALAVRAGLETAMQLDDKSIWFPAGHEAGAGCASIDSIEEFETCVLDPRELTIDNPAHVIWAKQYLAAQGLELEGYAATTATTEACVNEPFVGVPDWWPAEPTVKGDTGTTTGGTTTGTLDPPIAGDTATPIVPDPGMTPTAYSKACPCTRQVVATKEKTNHTNPETYVQWKSKGSGAVKWEKSGVQVGGDFEMTGEKKSTDWTIETVTCYAVQEDRGTKDNPFLVPFWLSPACNVLQDRCSSCQADSNEYAYGFEDYRTMLIAFDPKSGEFKTSEKRDSPCKPAGTVHRTQTF